MSIFNHLKLNWHFINKCNMQCKFCYSSKESCEDITFDVVPKIKPFKEINLVGGEPTIYGKYIYLLEKLHSQGHILSIVSNGAMFLRDNNIFSKTVKYCETVGLSIDSINNETCINIGRKLYNKKTISEEDYLYICKKIKDSGRLLKINTVINRYNYKENLNSFIEKIKPDKWKIFQVLPINNLNPCEDLLITKKEFNYFLANHSSHKNIMYIENNNAMTSSYIMLDSKGRFFNNINNKYIYSKSLIYDNVSLEEEFSKMKYDISKYNDRYIKLENK